MNSFDSDILLSLNPLLGRWPGFDSFISAFQHSNLLKGALFFSLIWYLWFRPQPNEREALQVRSAQYQATVGLVRALGGGWS